MTDLSRLADAWLAGWDAGWSGKPESRCPFASGEDNQFVSMWHSGWVAGARGSPRDRRVKGTFVAISIGKEKKA